MFEVGKTYKSNTGQAAVKCLYVGNCTSFMQWADALGKTFEGTISNSSFHFYFEYKEPKSKTVKLFLYEGIHEYNLGKIHASTFVHDPIYWKAIGVKEVTVTKGDKLG